jgi:hypothetical protein
MGCITSSFARFCSFLVTKPAETTVNLCNSCAVSCGSNNTNMGKTLPPITFEVDGIEMYKENLKKFRKQPRVKFPKSKGVVCTPTVLEIRQGSSLPRSKPQILLDEGWTIYFGDEVGIPSLAPTHLHIRNTLDGSIGVCLRADLFNCLLQAMLELKKHY